MEPATCSHPVVYPSVSHIHQQSQSSGSSVPQPSGSSQAPRQIHPLPPRPIVQELFPSSTVKHYRPKHGKRCHRWLRDECKLGFDCEFIHGDLDYDIEEPASVATLARVPPAQGLSAAQLSQRAAQAPQGQGKAQKMPQAAQTQQLPQGPETAPMTRVKHPRPRTTELCWRWQKNMCSLGYDCKWIHGDLKYDDDDDEPVSVLSFTYFDVDWLLICIVIAG